MTEAENVDQLLHVIEQLEARQNVQICVKIHYQVAYKFHPPAVCRSFMKEAQP